MRIENGGQAIATSRWKATSLFYRGYQIRVMGIRTRFGRLYVASNTIGEPYLDQPAFTTMTEAIRWDKKNVDAYLEDN